LAEGGLADVSAGVDAPAVVNPHARAVPIRSAFFRDLLNMV
jgi:hypothetical protein